MTNDEVAEWWGDHDPDQPMVFNTTLIRALTIHGGLCLALKHPAMRDYPRQTILEAVAGLERAFEDLGFSAPAQGWRGNICLVDKVI